MTSSSSHRDEDAYWNRRADLDDPDDLWGWHWPTQDKVLSDITKAIDPTATTTVPNTTEKSQWL